MSIPGRATISGTQAHLQSRNSWVRTLGRTKLAVGAVGFGTYRIDQGDPNHEKALRAVLNGRSINLIDTACNYTGGQSEELIGQVLEDEIRCGNVRREGLVVVTKVGYLTDDLLARAKEGSVPSDSISTLGPDHWHSFHPSVLDVAIPQSLARLRLECVDVFLLHNPEYYLKARGDEPIGALRDEFYRRIGEAFVCLEKWVEAGAIASYGISSNTLGFPDDDRASTSLVELSRIAEKIVGKDHHFRVIQCPLNLVERQPLHAIANTEFGVLTNRPLNAIDQGVVVRLANDFTMHDALKFREYARRLRGCERTFKKTFADRCTGIDSRRVYFVNELAHGLARFPSRISLSDYMTYTHWPQVRHVFSELDVHFKEDSDFHGWRHDYWEALDGFVRASMAQLEQRDMKKITPLFEALGNDLPAQFQDVSMAQQAWWFAASRPGVTAVLAGARQPKYVDEIHGLAECWGE